MGATLTIPVSEQQAEPTLPETSAEPTLPETGAEPTLPTGGGFVTLCIACGCHVCDTKGVRCRLALSQAVDITFKEGMCGLDGCPRAQLIDDTFVAGPDSSGTFRVKRPIGG